MTDQTTFKKLKKVLEFVWNNEYSSFYRDKYSKVGINLIQDINSLEDFKKLPYLTKDELINSDPFKRFYMPQDSFSAFGISSGTSGGEPVIILRSNARKIYKLNKIIQRSLELGIKRCMAFSSPLLYRDTLPLEFQHKTIQRFLGNIYNLPLTAKVVAKLQIDALYIAPSYLIRAIPYLEQEYDLKKIKYIVLAGEYCSLERLRYFQEKFPKAVFKLKYASTEGGGIGSTCPFLLQDFNQSFHPSPCHYYEIDNTQDELILTHLNTAREFPLIRYKTGDRVRLSEEKCPCGKELKIKVFGRLGIDVFEIGGIYIYPEVVDNMLYLLRDKIGVVDWQLHIFAQSKKLQLQIAFKKGKLVKKLIQSKLLQEVFFIPESNLQNLIDKGVISVLEIIPVESIAFNPPKNKNIVYHEN